MYMYWLRRLLSWQLNYDHTFRLSSFAWNHQFLFLSVQILGVSLFYVIGKDSWQKCSMVEGMNNLWRFGHWNGQVQIFTCFHYVIHVFLRKLIHNNTVYPKDEDMSLPVLVFELASSAGIVHGLRKVFESDTFKLRSTTFLAWGNTINPTFQILYDSLVNNAGVLLLCLHFSQDSGIVYLHNGMNMYIIGAGLRARNRVQLDLITSWSLI